MIKKIKLPGKSLTKESFCQTLSDLYQISDFFKALGRGDLSVDDFINNCSPLFCSLCGSLCVINDHFDFKDPSFDEDFSEDILSLYHVFFRLSK